MRTDFAAALLTLMAAVLLASGGAWRIVLARWRAGQPAVSFEPRRMVPWRMADAGLIFGVWFLLSLALPVACNDWFGNNPALRSHLSGQPDLASVCRLVWSSADPFAFLFGKLAADLATFGFGLLWLIWRGARALDLGFDARRLSSDARLGAVAFAVVVTPMFAIQYALVYFWKSHHPLLTLMEDNLSLIPAVASAALTAPVVEEFLFRLVLQGALEAAEWQAVQESHAVAGNYAAAAPLVAATPSNEPPSDADRSARSPAIASQVAAPLVRALPGSMVWGLPAGVWPMTITATLFALLHADHGPDPIPLLLLAVALGYLYRQTHRLTPCIVVHALLNSLSLTLYWLGRGGSVGAL